MEPSAFGPLGAPVELIPHIDARAPVAIAAHPGGYLVAAGRFARWLNADASPASEVFAFADGVAPGGRTALSMTPPDAPTACVLVHAPALATGALHAVTVPIGSADVGASTLVMNAPGEWSDFAGVAVDAYAAPLGDRLVVVGGFRYPDYAFLGTTVLGADGATLHAPRDYDSALEVYGVLAVGGSSPSVLLSVADGDVSNRGTVRRLTMSDGHARWTIAGRLGPDDYVVLPEAPRAAPAEARLLGVLDDRESITARWFLAGAPGDEIVFSEPRPGSFRRPPRQMVVRGATQVIEHRDGSVEEVALGEDAASVAAYRLPHPGTLAFTSSTGLAVYLDGETLRGQPLGGG